MPPWCSHKTWTKTEPQELQRACGRHVESSSSTRVPRASTLHRASWGPEFAQCSHEQRPGKGTPAAPSMWKRPGFLLSFSTSGNPLVAGRGIAVGAHSATLGQDPACSSVSGGYSQSPLLCVCCPSQSPVTLQLLSLPEPVTLCLLSHCMDQTYNN